MALIQFRRGGNPDVKRVYLKKGEPFFDQDNEVLYVGGREGQAVQINTDNNLPAKVDALTDRVIAAERTANSLSADVQKSMTEIGTVKHEVDEARGDNPTLDLRFKKIEAQAIADREHADNTFLDKTTVNFADKEYVDSAVSGKVDKEYVDSAVANIDVTGKADKVYVDAQLGTKADGSDVDALNSVIGDMSTAPTTSKVIAEAIAELHAAIGSGGGGAPQGAIPIPSGSSLNDYQVEGDYVCETDAIASTISSKPTTAAFHMRVIKHSGVGQIVYSSSTSSPRIYFRNYNKNVWGIWSELGIASSIGNLSSLFTKTKVSTVAAINELFQSVSDGKSTVAAAITGKGVPTAADDTFDKMATNIQGIKLGSGNAKPADVLAGVTFSNDEGGQVGVMPNRGGLVEPTGTAKWGTGELAVYIPEGYYGSGAYGGSEVKVNFDHLWTADNDMHPANIKAGVELFGKTGTFTSDANAVASQILTGSSAYVNGAKVNGTMPLVLADYGDQKIATNISAGNYSGDGKNYIYLGVPVNSYLHAINWIRHHDPNFNANNIRSGVNMFGMLGTMPSGKRIATGTTQAQPNQAWKDYGNYDTYVYEAIINGHGFVVGHAIFWAPNELMFITSRPAVGYANRLIGNNTKWYGDTIAIDTYAYGLGSNVEPKVFRAAESARYLNNGTTLRLPLTFAQGIWYNYIIVEA